MEEGDILTTKETKCLLVAQDREDTTILDREDQLDETTRLEDSYPPYIIAETEVREPELLRHAHNRPR